MYVFFTILIILICVVLTLVVLIQNPKGGGLSAAFGGGGSQVMGVRRTTDFLEKATWYLAIALIVLSIGSSSFIEPTQLTAEEEVTTEMQDRASEVPPINIPDNAPVGGQ